MHCTEETQQHFYCGIASIPESELPPKPELKKILEAIAYRYHTLLEVRHEVKYSYYGVEPGEQASADVPGETIFYVKYLQGVIPTTAGFLLQPDINGASGSMSWELMSDTEADITVTTAGTEWHSLTIDDKVYWTKSPRAYTVVTNWLAKYQRAQRDLDDAHTALLAALSAKS